VDANLKFIKESIFNYDDNDVLKGGNRGVETGMVCQLVVFIISGFLIFMH